MLRLLARNWWVLVLRGLLAVIFGVLALVWPGATIRVLVVLFGAYAIVDGLVSFFSALTNRRRGWLLLLEALISIAVGVLVLIWPQITALVMLYLIAGWAVLTGILEIVAAVELRREVEGEWALGLAGVLSILIGVLLALQPGSGLVFIAWLIGIYAIVFGILLTILGFRLRRLRERLA